jgi:Zn-dependent alcohol dehydrogenase
MAGWPIISSSTRLCAHPKRERGSRVGGASGAVGCGLACIKYLGVLDKVRKDGKGVLVLRTGMIGIATVASLIALGVERERIMVVGRNKARNEVVRQFGVEKIYGNEEDIVAISKEVFDGYVFFSNCLELIPIPIFGPGCNVRAGIRHSELQ